MIGRVWTRSAIGWALLAAALPVAVALVFERGVAGLFPLGFGLAIIAFWQVIFRVSAGVPLAPAAGIAALSLALLVPADVGLWQLALAASFGVVVGELVFGGWGRNFLSSGTVALAFMSLSLPSAEYLSYGVLMALAVLPGALILAVTGILAIPIILGFSLGLAAVGSLIGVSDVFLSASGSLAFIVTFLVADPVVSASTGAGRWLNGLTAGALTALLSTGTTPVNAAIFAALLAALFAPLIDQAILAVMRRQRILRHG